MHYAALVFVFFGVGVVVVVAVAAAVAAELPIGEAAMRGDALGVNSGFVDEAPIANGWIVGVTQVVDEAAQEEGFDGLKPVNTEQEAMAVGGSFVDEDVV